MTRGNATVKAVQGELHQHALIICYHFNETFIITNHVQLLHVRNVFRPFQTNVLSMKTCASASSWMIILSLQSYSSLGAHATPAEAMALKWPTWIRWEQLRSNFRPRPTNSAGAFPLTSDGLLEEDDADVPSKDIIHSTQGSWWIAMGQINYSKLQHVK